MNSYFISLMLFTLLSMSCQHIETQSDVPNCIKEKIQIFADGDPLCDKGASVTRYNFQGQYVYVFDPGNCIADGMAEVYDEQCKLICGLGGIAGFTTCNGEDFSQNATNPVVVWHN